MIMAKVDGVTADTQDRYVFGPGALYKNFTDFDNMGTLIGATRGGTSVDLGIDWHESDLDGSPGPTMGQKRIAGIEPTLDVELIEHTATNWLDAIAGSESATLTPSYTLDDVAEGDGAITSFSLPSLTGSGLIFDSTLKVYLDGVLQTRGATEDYTYDDSTQEITFTSAPGTDVTVTATYIYDSSGASGDFNKITLGQITDSDFINLGLVFEYAEPTYTKNGVFILKNALAENFSMDLPTDNEDEGTLPLTFTGHFDPSSDLTLDNAPVEFWFPNA